MAAFAASRQQNVIQTLLLVLGVFILSIGLAPDTTAQALDTMYNEDRIVEAARKLLRYVEGSFGALVMVGAGIFAILGAAFGQYKGALAALVVAVGSFILRSFISTFFNAEPVFRD